MVLSQGSERLIEACGDPPGFICERVLDWTGNVGMAQATDWFLDKPFTIVIILVVAFIVNRLLRRAIRRFADRLAGDTLADNLRAAARARTVGGVLRSFSTVVVYSVASLLVLGELGQNLGPLLAGAGIVGVAIGFGAQSLVRDFLAGIFILIEDQYGVGDIVDVGEANGVVEALSLRTTRMRDVNGTVWHVPNGEIHRVRNMSQQWARALLDLSVAYGSDVRRARQIIKRVADEVWKDETWAAKVLEEPEVWGVESLGADGVAIRLVVKTQPSAQWDVMRELRLRLKEAFDAEGIEIPFPQRTMWLRQEPGAEPTDKPLRPNTSSGQT